MTKKQPTQRTLLAVLFFGVLMGALDIAIVAPALHPIQVEFGITPRTTAWVFSIYLIFSLIGNPLMAKLADLHGRRLVYVADILLFATGSMVVVAGGVTGYFPLFLVGRAIQGLGAGGIFPVAAAVIGDTVSPEKRGGALGLIGAVWGLAFILGPILGGLLLPFGWPVLFLINLPAALLLILFGLRVLPAHKKESSPPLDLRALVLLAATLATFALGVNQIDIDHLWSSVVSMAVWPFFLGAVVFLLALIKSEKRKAANPLFPHHLFKNGQLKLIYVIGAIYGFAKASFSFIPMLAMAAFGPSGLTVAQSSYLMMPLVLAMAVCSPVVGRLLDKVGSKVIIFGGVTLATLGFTAMGFCSNSMAGFVGGELLLGFGLSALAGAPMRYVVLAETPAKDRTIAQGLTSLFSSMGSVVGGVLIGGAAASRGSTWEAWSFAFFLVAFPAAAAIVLSFFLKNRAEEMETARQNH